METTEKRFFVFCFDKIFSILSPVVTGTVDFVTIILNFDIELFISLTTLKIWLRSAALLPFFVGVPTHINTISDSDKASVKFVEKFNLPDFKFFFTNSSKPGSYIGIIPFFNFSILPTSNGAYLNLSYKF